MTTPRKSKTLTFSLPPEMEAQLRRVMKEDDLSVSELLREAMTAAEAKSGKYTYYICHSLLKRGKGTCKTPRLMPRNSRRSSSMRFAPTSSPSPTSETW